MNPEEKDHEAEAYAERRKSLKPQIEASDRIDEKLRACHKMLSEALIRNVEIDYDLDDGADPERPAGELDALLKALQEQLAETIGIIPKTRI